MTAFLLWNVEETCQVTLGIEKIKNRYIHCRSIIDNSGQPPRRPVRESNNGAPPLPPKPALKALDDHLKNIGLRCFSCGGLGHIQSMCPKKKLILAKRQYIKEA